MIKNVLFDFDGVIIESNEIKALAFFELYKPFGEDVANQVFKLFTQEGGIPRDQKFISYHQKLLNQKLTPDQVSKLSERFSKLVFNNVKNAPFINGLKAFIIKNYNQMHFSIISGTPHLELLRICNALEIEKYFVQICGSPKNKVDWCTEIISKNKLEKSQTVFIGDSKVDYDCAMAIGIPFILREHELNKNIFNGYDAVRIKDFTNFQHILEQI